MGRRKTEPETRELSANRLRRVLEAFFEQTERVPKPRPWPYDFKKRRRPTPEEWGGTITPDGSLIVPFKFWSQEQLAGLFESSPGEGDGVSKTALQHWLAGKSRPRRRHLTRLALLLTFPPPGPRLIGTPSGTPDPSVLQLCLGITDPHMPEETWSGLLLTAMLGRGMFASGQDGVRIVEQTMVAQRPRCGWQKIDSTLTDDRGPACPNCRLPETIAVVAAWTRPDVASHLDEPKAG